MHVWFTGASNLRSIVSLSRRPTTNLLTFESSIVLCQTPAAFCLMQLVQFHLLASQCTLFQLIVSVMWVKVVRSQLVCLRNALTHECTVAVETLAPNSILLVTHPAHPVLKMNTSSYRFCISFTGFRSVDTSSTRLLLQVGLTILPR